MTKHLEVYKCGLCGNIVEVVHASGGTLVCCGAEMILQEEKTADKATEKHVPVVEKVEGGYKVTVGTTLHPMTDEHHIEWIELVTDKQVLTQYLKPGDAPEAFFKTSDAVLYAREYCNLHGHWKG